MFKYWNAGSPLIAHVKGSGNKAKLTLPDGTVRMGNIKSDPDIDLYEFVETGPRPDKYQNKGTVTLDNDGWTITATQTVQYKPIEQVQDTVKSDIKNKRNAVASGRIEWSPDAGVNTYIVQTDVASQVSLTGAVMHTDKNGNPNQAWRMADNEVVTLTKAQFDAMAGAVGDHVAACYSRQATLEGLIDGAGDVAAALAIDIEAGWPANPVGQG